MKYIVSRFEHNLSWIKEYTDDIVLYDRSKIPLENAIIVPNLGSDIADKFSFIIDNYDHLPDVAIYCKANLFKYITPQEFDLIKDNKTFTPILTQNHKTYNDDRGVVCFYKKGLYYERNDYWYLNAHPAKYANEIKYIFQMDKREFNAFAPGSNYILPKKNILKHPKELYVKLREYMAWDVYPGDCQLMERNLYYLWNLKEDKNESVFDNPAIGVPAG